MPLIPNQKITIIDFSEFDNSTRVRELRIAEVTGSFITYHPKGSRLKRYYLAISPEMIIFNGWGLALHVLTSGLCNLSDRRYIFKTTNAPRLREYLQSNNINQSFNRWQDIVAVGNHNTEWISIFKQAV